jgi:hypothetical protein
MRDYAAGRGAEKHIPSLPIVIMEGESPIAVPAMGLIFATGSMPLSSPLRRPRGNTTDQRAILSNGQPGKDCPILATTSSTEPLNGPVDSSLVDVRAVAN